MMKSKGFNEAESIARVNRALDSSPGLRDCVDCGNPSLECTCALCNVACTCEGCGDELDKADAYHPVCDSGATETETLEAVRKWEAEGCPGPFYCRSCMDTLVKRDETMARQAADEALPMCSTCGRPLDDGMCDNPQCGPSGLRDEKGRFKQQP